MKEEALVVTRNAQVGPPARAGRVRAAAEAAGLDAMVVTTSASIFYLTGFDPLALERLFAVVLPVDGPGALVIPSLDVEDAAGIVSDLEVVGYDAATSGMPELVGALGDARVLGIEEDWLPYARATGLQEAERTLRPAGALVTGLRARKDDVELDAIRRSATIVAAAIERMFAHVRVGDSERAVNARIAFEVARDGATESHPVVLFGENAAMPHRVPGERRLADGDVICADVSARVDGYWADLCRCGTVGPPSEWVRSAWEIVRDAQRDTIAGCRPGTPARAVDAIQRRVIEAAENLGRCLHGAGHAVGVELHEAPYLGPRNAAPLEPGNVVTVEPGLYASGIGGIRLEDDVAVTDRGPELLSDLPLELREVPRISAPRSA